MRLFPSPTWCLFLLLALESHAEEIRRMEPLLGTYVEIVAEGGTAADLQVAVDSGFDAIREVDGLLSSFKPESELNRINRSAGVRAVAISPWTYECLERAITIGRGSNGAFDITCQPLLDLWGFLSKKYHVPSAAEIEAEKRLVGYRRLELTESRDGKGGPVWRTAFLTQKGMAIDVGGIGKGFAVDKAVHALKSAGVKSGRVRAWGDSFGFGDKDWTLEIEKGKSITLRNEAASTSGDYENFFESGAKHYAHIIDPRTGRPVRGTRSVTVKAPTATESDAWSTAIFVNPGLKPEGIRIVFLERE